MNRLASCSVIKVGYGFSKRGVVRGSLVSCTNCFSTSTAESTSVVKTTPNTNTKATKNRTRKRNRNGKVNSLFWSFDGNQTVSSPPETDFVRARQIFNSDGVYLGRGTKPSDFETLNPDSPEFAFVGRSNVGKSSLLNKLFQLPKKTGAKVSKTPGRTVAGHLYGIGENKQWKHRNLPSWELTALDLPGYGYAKVPKHIAEDMSSIVRDYLNVRSKEERLLCAFLLIDARHGITSNDYNMISMLDSVGVRYQVVLTKCDMVKKLHLDKVSRKVVEELCKPIHGNCFPRLLGTSSKLKTGVESGVERLQAEMIKLVRENASERVLSLWARSSRKKK